MKKLTILALFLSFPSFSQTAAPAPFAPAVTDQVCQYDYECAVVDLDCCETGDVKKLAAVSKSALASVLGETKRTCRAIFNALVETKKAALEAQKKAVTAKTLLDLEIESKADTCKGQSRALFAPRVATTCTANVCTLK